MKTFHALVLAAALTGCIHLKKSSNSDSLSRDARQSEKQEVTDRLVKVSNELNTQVRTVTIRTEYYPLDSLHLKKGSAVPEKGTVRSVQTTTTTLLHTDRGVSDLSQKQDTRTMEQGVSENTTRTADSQQPARDPRRWLWILITAAIAAGLFFYIRTTPLWTFVNTHLATINALFKSAGKSRK